MLGLEALFLTAFIATIFLTVPIYIALTYVFRGRRRRSKQVQRRIILHIGTRDGATMEDIVMNVNVSLFEAHKHVSYLISRGVVKREVRKGKITYVLT